MSSIELVRRAGSGRALDPVRRRGAAGRARVGDRGVHAGPRDLDLVPDRQRRPDRHGLRDRSRRARSSASTPAGCRPRRSSWPTACATATRASSSSSSSPTPTRSRAWSASTASISSRPRVDLRLLCCNLRKVRPLTKHLHSLDAWVTGLRRDQWASRTNIRKVEIDHDHGAIVKLNPLAEWTSRRSGTTCANGRSVPLALRPGLHLDRLRAVHARDRAGRGEPRRPLVVGVERAEGVRHPLLDRERRPRARAARAARRTHVTDAAVEGSRQRRGGRGRPRRGAGRARDGAGRGAPRPARRRRRRDRRRRGRGRRRRRARGAARARAPDRPHPRRLRPRGRAGRAGALPPAARSAAS